jgi:hypothetical protein
MLRALLAAAAVAGSALTVSPPVSADGMMYDGDVPGMAYDAFLSAPCYRWDRYIFGRGPTGQALACHWIPNQGYLGWGSPPPGTGFWVLSHRLYGTQTPGSACPGSQAAAQTPDGRPLVCAGARGWEIGYFRSGDWGNGRFIFPDPQGPPPPAPPPPPA